MGTAGMRLVENDANHCHALIYALPLIRVTPRLHCSRLLRDTRSWFIHRLISAMGYKFLHDIFLLKKNASLVRMHPALYPMGHKRWYGTEQTLDKFTDKMIPQTPISKNMASVFLFYLCTSLEWN